jgi:hypothetical protein
MIAQMILYRSMDLKSIPTATVPTRGSMRRAAKRNGDLLSEVLRDFVRDVQMLTHKIKPHALVSFNSVNEFGVEQMYDVTDFLFLEIWRGHTDKLEDLVDICFRHRAPRSQRVILKVYPADMSPRTNILAGRLAASSTRSHHDRRRFSHGRGGARRNGG